MEIFFANFVSYVLAIVAFGCAFLLFLTCARLLVLQSFKMYSSKESETTVSSRDDEGESSVFRIFLKKCCIALYEMLHSFGHPSVKHD